MQQALTRGKFQKVHKDMCVCLHILFTCTHAHMHAVLGKFLQAMNISLLARLSVCFLFVCLFPVCLFVCLFVCFCTFFRLITDDRCDAADGSAAPDWTRASVSSEMVFSDITSKNTLFISKKNVSQKKLLKSGTSSYLHA